MTSNNSIFPIIVSEIELCLNQRQGSLHLKDSNKENGSPGVLLSNLVFQALGERNGKENLSPKQRAEIRQWIEYVCIYGHLLQNPSTAQPVIKEIDGILGTKSFLTSSSSSTVVDAILYALLYKIMSNASYQDKEQYMNISRWFNTIQQETNIRRTRNIVNFSRSCLYT